MRVLLPALLLSVGVGVVAVAGPPASEQEASVPVAVQISIFLRIVAFDRALTLRAPQEIVFGIAYQRGNRASVLARDEASRALRASEDGVGGIRIRIEPIDLDAARLSEEILRLRLTHLYVTPLRATDLATITALTRAASVLTLAGVPAYVAAGLSIGVELRDGRPRILINLAASRLEGADLSSELLKLATIVE